MSELIDDAGVRGAPPEINLQPRAPAGLVIPRLGARCLASDAIQIFRGFNDRRRQWISACPARGPQYFLINTSDGDGQQGDRRDTRRIYYFVANALSRRDVIVSLPG